MALQLQLGRCCHPALDLALAHRVQELALSVCLGCPRSLLQPAWQVLALAASVLVLEARLAELPVLPAAMATAEQLVLVHVAPAWALPSLDGGGEPDRTDRLSGVSASARAEAPARGVETTAAFRDIVTACLHRNNGSISVVSLLPEATASTVIYVETL